MKLQNMYTALLTTDLAAAEVYEAARPWTGLPADGHAGAVGSVRAVVSTSDEIAGRGVMFLYVDDVAVERIAGPGDRSRERHSG